MSIYISLIKYTAQGAIKVKESPDRLALVRQAAQSMGGHIKEWYLTFGQYDAVAVIEAPNEETVAQILLALAVAGNVQTETFRAFTEDESRILLARLPQSPG